MRAAVGVGGLDFDEPRSRLEAGGQGGLPQMARRNGRVERACRIGLGGHFAFANLDIVGIGFEDLLQGDPLSLAVDPHFDDGLFRAIENVDMHEGFRR